MPINILKSQTTNSGLKNLYINNKEEKRKIRIDTLHLISYDLARLKKRS